MPNIIDIINNNKLESEYNVINELEDTIIDLFDKKSDSELFNNDLLLLTELTKELSEKLKINLYSEFNIHKLNLDKKIIDNLDRIVITGPLLRSILVDVSTIGTDIRKEIFISCVKNLKPAEIIDTTYTENEIMYYKTIENITVHILKSEFKNPSHVILQNCNLKRIGFYLNKIYCSTMFIADYNKYSHTINSNFVEPIFKTKLDVFDIHIHIKREITIFDIINKKNYEYFKKNNNKHDQLNLLKNGETVIEFALKLYMEEQNDIIKSQIKLIIIDLSHKQYIRPPAFYARLLKLDVIDKDLFVILSMNKLYTQMSDINFDLIKSITDINNAILKYYISTDASDEFYSMLRFKDDKYLKLDSAMFNFIIDANPKNIIINGIKSNYFSERSKYKLILWTQNLDYFNIIGDDFNMDIAINFLDEIIENCLIKSFYFLYKIDDTIINTIDSEGNTFLHIITEKNKYQDMIKILLKLDDGILYRKNKNNQTPLMSHIKNNNYNIISILIDFIIDSKN
jgi:hypothetical protein